MKLNELFESRMTDEGIHEWMQEHAKLIKYGHVEPTYEIKNGVVNVNGSILIKNFEGAELPVQFGKVTRSFSVRNLRELSSWNGFPEEAEHVCITGTRIKSVVGVEKHLKKLKTLDMILTQIQQGGLGILLIEGLQSLYFTSSSFDKKAAQKSRDAFIIIDKYVGRPHDIYECQSELIEQGLDEFAEL